MNSISNTPRKPSTGQLFDSGSNPAVTDGETVIDTIAFLARTENRVAVLTSLAEAPCTRRELMAASGMSRVTLGRILRDLEARNWIVKTGSIFTITPLGKWVISEFTALCEVIEAEHKLRELMPWLLTDTVTFDITRLSDADIILATESNPMAPLQWSVEALAAGTQLRSVLTAVTVPFIDGLWDCVIHGVQTFEAVAPSAVYKTMLNDPGMRTKSRDLLDADDAAFFINPDVDVIVNIVNDRVYISVTDEANTPRALICSDDEIVYEWAVNTFKQYCERAEPVYSDMFTA